MEGFAGEGGDVEAAFAITPFGRVENWLVVAVDYNVVVEDVGNFLMRKGGEDVLDVAHGVEVGDEDGHS